MTSTADAFNALAADLDYPMFIVTAAAGDQRAGCLVGFATQTSIDPPRFIVCISEQNHTHRVAEHSEALAVHFVPADASELVELFGGRTGDEVDKFAHCAWRPGPQGVPLLDRCHNRFIGRVLERWDAGDHTAFLLEPIAAERDAALDPFPFQRARRIEPGHEA